MSNDSKSCPKCQGRMSDGFLVDYSHAATLAAVWHPGPVVKRWFSNWGIKVDPAQKREITACRCDRCGFLELYAP